MTDKLTSLLNRQLKSWELAYTNYKALKSVQTREINVDGFPIRLQFNPARTISTNAKTDAGSIARRTCFLCADKRPAEQLIENDIYGFDTLVNPFPIFPKHFTIASVQHIEQNRVNFADMKRLATLHPGYVIFYNGAEAGASAPDHLHFQIGNIDFLPICKLAEKHKLQKTPMRVIATEKDINFSSNILEGTVNEININLLNVLMWRNTSTEKLHTLIFPRRKHRPTCYHASGYEQIMVSPGAVDMAGVLVLPRLEDFNKITAEDIKKIYAEV